MWRRLPGPGFVLLCGLLGLPALAADDSERARLAAERQTLLAGFAAEEAACRERFVVTPCVDDVRARRRAALAPLRSRELEIDDQLRRERAAQRQAAREARMAQAAPPQPAGARASGATTSTAVAEAGQAGQAPHKPPPLQNRAGVNQIRAEQAAERAQDQRRRSDEVLRTQADIARRQRERQAGGQKSAPLPLPDAASAATPAR